jgi:hypothetical protein
MAKSKLIDITVKILLVIISPIVFLGICELTIRIFAPQIHGWIGENPHGADPVLERVFRPNMSAGYIASNGRRISIHTNSMGFRGTREYDAKDSLVFRIAGLGDSFTQGAGVNDDETYLSIWEQLVNASAGGARRMEAVNMGVDTYGTIKERIFLERYGLAMQPDLITIGFLPNDLWDNMGWMERQQNINVTAGAERKDDIAPLSPLIGLVYKLKENSHFVIWLGKKLMSIPGVYKFAYHNRPDKFDFTNPSNQQVIGKAYALVDEELGRIANLADSISAKVAVISIPTRYQMVMGVDDENGDIRYLDNLLAASCRQRGIEFVPLLDTLRAANRIRECYFPMDGHLNLDGHRVVGEYLANWVKTKDFYLNN